MSQNPHTSHQPHLACSFSQEPATLSNAISQCNKWRTLKHYVCLGLGLIAVTALNGCFKIEDNNLADATPATERPPTSSDPTEPSNPTTPIQEARPEFIDLNQPATVEFATLTVGETSYHLNQSDLGDIDGHLVTFLYDEADNAVIDEPTAALMVSDNGVRLLCNHQNDIREISIDAIEEQHSRVVLDESVFTVTGQLDNLPVKLVYSTSMGGMGTSSITIDEELSAIMLSGSLGTRTYNQLFDLLQHRDDLSELYLVDISGSINDDINVQTGRLIRRAGLTTIVPAGSTIASGGVDLFCAGEQRLIDSDARLLVHSWGGEIDGEIVSAHELPKDHPGHVAQLSYFTAMLGDPNGSDFYWFTIHSAPFGEDLHRMSDEEISRITLKP